VDCELTALSPSVFPRIPSFGHPAFSRIIFKNCSDFHNLQVNLLSRTTSLDSVWSRTRFCGNPHETAFNCFFFLKHYALVHRDPEACRGARESQNEHGKKCCCAQPILFCPILFYPTTAPGSSKIKSTSLDRIYQPPYYRKSLQHLKSLCPT